jgi:hypothetical protein
VRSAAPIVAAMLAAGRTHAEPLPPGALEVFTGGASGAGADARRLGFGYVVGAQASYQPMKTERWWGPALRWSILFGGLYEGSAEQVNPPLRTVQMDLAAGVRFRPWSSRRRYFTARAGVGLLRTNDPVGGSRNFVGPVASLGIDQYFGTIVTGLDLRYGLVANGPGQLALVLRFGLAGP